jgi:glucose-6-phosphate isomerase
VDELNEHERGGKLRKLIYSQNIDGCLEAGIGTAGLSQASLDTTLERLKPRLDSLRKAYADGSLPLLRVPEWHDDIAEAKAALQRLSRGAETLIFFGTGGSSLGGQTLAQLGGWSIPGDNGNGNGPRPRLRFYDNLDARTLERSLSRLDLTTSRFIVVSKSGNTPETLVQAISALQAVQAAGLEERIPELFLALTEPAKPGVNNGLRALCEKFGISALDHDPNIGGRYSALTNVGLLPALAKNLDVEALRRGAGNVVQALLDPSGPSDLAPAIGAALTVAMAKERGIRCTVMLPYSDRLSRFAQWYVQLWAESLGKGGEGTTPLAALGPVDQHSQLQLWLDGTPQHLVTVIRPDCTGQGPSLSPELAATANAPYLANRTVGDLVAAQERAVPEALIEAGRPVRIIDLPQLNEETLGALMMHFMLETILAAHLLAVDPFDQPAVESGKILTRRYLEAGENKDAD